MIKNMLSVLIPNWNCAFVTKTIQDLFEKAVGEIEIIVTVGDKWPETLVEDKRVTYIHAGSVKGMRFGINAAAALAKGKYIMKTDDHCLFAPGFDKVLIDNHLEDNWVSVPRRYSLDAENWQINQTRPFRDYHYLSFPAPDKPQEGLRGMEWPEMTRKRSNPKYDVDDLMSFQGSCWFMTKNHFDNFLHGLDEAQYGTFAQEPQEIGLKTWLGNGRLIINKKTWYAHLHKDKRYMSPQSREYKKELHDGHVFTTNYWMNNKWPERKHDLAWLIEKFWPLPGWPDNWRQKHG
ncbi:MAG: Uncharacterized protein G01um101416_700 [Microgenomates group bacterium Gr01-1014_16]|nr:MAG: Uncharacterized protein G01um101416_700 [Microgenomates group bacterium Gr01-1014_16]